MPFFKYNQAWTVAYNVFVFETFINAGESVIATQRAFHVHFMLCQNDTVSDRIFNP